MVTQGYRQNGRSGPETAARSSLLVGTAGWALPRGVAHRFPGEGTHLTRYAQVLTAVEINSSFHRPHRRQTYAKWAASVPEDFRFSVKLPKAITHRHKLVDAQALLQAFLEDAAGLGARLGCLLVQLPPSLVFVSSEVDAFFGALRERYDGDVAVEPRNASWFAGHCAQRLEQHRLARVAADPARVLEAAVPAGWTRCAYWRLHGSPRTYYSAYSDADLDRVARAMLATGRQAKALWCIFDNTTLGAATENALALQSRLDGAI
ncbi:MAG: DUF72 domain-containing protein [Betaproteobacteria bacterium]